MFSTTHLLTDLGLFPLTNGVICGAEVSHCEEPSVSGFPLLDGTLGVTSKHTFLWAPSQRCSPVCLSKGFLVLHFTFKSMVRGVNFCRRCEVWGRVWFVYLVGRFACGCLSDGSSTTSGKIFPSWSCFCTFPNLSGWGRERRGRGLLCSLPVFPPHHPPAPPWEDCVDFLGPSSSQINCRSSLLFSESLLTVW